MFKKTNQMFKCTASNLGRKSRSGAMIAAFVAGMLAMTGCEILSICTFPSNKLATTAALPAGKFVAMDFGDGFLEIAVDGSGYRLQSEGRTEYLELFELDGFVGFNSRHAIPNPDEMELIPESQREMIENVLSNGLRPWKFGAIEFYGEAFMMLIPSLIVDEVAMYIEQNHIKLIDGGISHSAAYRAAQEQVRAEKKANAGELQKFLGLDDLHPVENKILMTTPDQLEEMMADLLRTDYLVPIVYLPASASGALQGLEDEELIEALREYNQPLAQRYEHIMAAFEARNEDD